MPRNILLVEPDYKTKFPPLGLMKISTYHKMLGDKVRFVKGYHDIQSNIWERIDEVTQWDRIYIATLFTYNWKVTVDTITFYKSFILKGDIDRLFVGGILASLMPEELQWTGIRPPIKGLLTNSKMVDDDNKYIIDQMIPDYSLFDAYPNKYNLLDSYIGYSTRGCVRKCAFCGVHILEPKFIDYIDIKPYVKQIENIHGAKQHLVLLDNNVLASKNFEKIIYDIRDLGFYKDAIDPKTKRKRYVDFNQGVDARHLTKEKIKLLATIPINPLRIAFDNIKYEKIYSRCVRLAAEQGIKHLSNYILYNYADTPEDFWRRLKINIDLNKKYGLEIYSFPMKYIPLNAKDRSFIDEPRWNWQFLRGVQRILNVMKGAVMPHEDFFNRAFGETEKEFISILYMPEKILMNRTDSPQKKEKEWRSKFNKLTESENKELLRILCDNRTKSKLMTAYTNTGNRKIKDLLEYYLPEHAGSDPVSEDLELEESNA